ncbi:protein phosphatase 2C domain-containing protein [Tepidiforma sp.]|jgi:serine/threonine protein phosphatase PrpC|uniref:PP2C family protein-serine/threonine phosphatase n=1 Tax=Tepidiforma sp. TaxID=2682230 RepID=UPI002608D4A7|nr:protein phosphatase 2C domain-containing protein [Tepidiforma sp.]MCX7617376.1 protein phosphatase 2C domain-containing protein [Tepidiforma sp.]
MSELAGGTWRGWRWAAATDIGRRRAENQDAWLVRETSAGLLLAVADGMGGHPNGAWAARYAVDDLARWLIDRPGEASDLVAGVAALNRRLRDAAARLGTPGAGTTLTAALLESAALRWVHVGDSRLYVLHADGFRQVTRDHNLAAEPGGHPGLANVLTRCLGMAGELEPDAGDLPVPEAVLLATDGLYHLVPADALAEALRSPDLERAASLLVGLANDAGGPDNITVVLARRAIG